MTARHIADLETDELISRLFAYSNLHGRCVREIRDRGLYNGDILIKSHNSFKDGRNSITEDDSSAMEWIRFIVGESFQPVFADPAEELERLKRYLITASLVAAESGALDDEQ